MDKVYFFIDVPSSNVRNLYRHYAECNDVRTFLEEPRNKLMPIPAQGSKHPSRRSHLSRQLGCCAGLAALLSVSAWGQGITADIQGSISDSSGAGVQKATATISDVSKGWVRTAVSGTAGEYEFLQLPPADTFVISAEREGFKRELRSGIVLQTGQQSRIDLALSPGTVSESVTVEANASLVQSEDAQVGALVDERKVEQLPLNGRQFWQLAPILFT